MKKLVLALAAHVDAGKTTLAEALLHKSGVIRQAGRVDKGNSVLDSDDQERKRGITVSAGEAFFEWNGTEICLLDTPGHVDFSPEAERVLNAADAALLVISGLDGVQAHTLALWKLLEKRKLPVLLFVSKMDMGRRTQKDLCEELQNKLSGAVLPWKELKKPQEEAALLDEVLLERFLSGEKLTMSDTLPLIWDRKAFPLLFGSGLREEGTEDLLEALSSLAEERENAKNEAPSAFVYKISYDEKGTRLSHVKVLKGCLSSRDRLETKPGTEEKISFIRRYTGARYVQTESLTAGSTGAIAGLEHTYAGQGLGEAKEAPGPVFEPVMRYTLILPEGLKTDQALPLLKRLEEEDPSLNIRSTGRTDSVTADLMGNVEGEILTEKIRERFGWETKLKEGQILYRETLTEETEGVGHYEPLRHYAEVHLAMRPLKRGSGIILKDEAERSLLPADARRLILGQLAQTMPLGVLAGAPICDMEIALLGGKGHIKHTEGGDYREAARRAVRQGLMTARSRGKVRLLEPWYRFRLSVPSDKTGRALSDIQARFGEASQESLEDDMAVLQGRAPLSCLQDYASVLASYTGGRGRISLWADGYDLCHNEEEVVRAAAYDPLADRENPPDSVFCRFGAGVSVPWNEVPEYMHLPFFLKKNKTDAGGQAVNQALRPGGSDKELEELMLKEFGPIKRPVISGAVHAVYPSEPADPVKLKETDSYIIDGYNLIFAWEEYKTLAAESLELARHRLAQSLQNFAGFTGKKILLVFDGYQVGGNAGETEIMPALKIAYTKEHETADMYIEKLLTEAPGSEKLTRAVVSNDRLIRLSTIRQGALRIRCEEFIAEYDEAAGRMRESLENGGIRIGSRLSWEEETVSPQSASRQ